MRGDLIATHAAEVRAALDDLRRTSTLTDEESEVVAALSRLSDLTGLLGENLAATNRVLDSRTGHLA